jgi:hypothetical protein
MKFKIEIELTEPKGSTVKGNTAGMSREEIVLDALCGHLDGLKVPVWGDDEDKPEQWTITQADDR